MSDTATRLQLYKDAEAKALQGQRVRIGDREVTRADLSFIQNGIKRLQLELAAEARNARGHGAIVPAQINLTGFRNRPQCGDGDDW